ncbi:hypothetical protein E4U41_005680 [Claviceps citrina]|nr:hypothetical protein E4U41_005680 [Claviceps citrina]
MVVLSHLTRFLLLFCSLFTASSDGYYLDASCKTDHAMLVDWINGAWKLNDAAIGNLESLRQMRDVGKITSFHALTRAQATELQIAQRNNALYTFGGLFVGKKGALKMAGSRVYDTLQAVRQLRNLDAGQPKTAPLQYPMKPTPENMIHQELGPRYKYAARDDFIVFCDMSRFENFKDMDCLGSPATGLACDTATGMHVILENTFEQCATSKNTRAIMWPDTDRSKPTVVQMCPGYLESFRRKKIRTLNDMFPVMLHGYEDLRRSAKQAGIPVMSGLCGADCSMLSILTTVVTAEKRAYLPNYDVMDAHGLMGNIWTRTLHNSRGNMKNAENFGMLGVLAAMLHPPEPNAPGLGATMDGDIYSLRSTANRLGKRSRGVKERQAGHVRASRLEPRFVLPRGERCEVRIGSGDVMTIPDAEVKTLGGQIFCLPKEASPTFGFVPQPTETQGVQTTMKTVKSPTGAAPGAETPRLAATSSVAASEKPTAAGKTGAVPQETTPTRPTPDSSSGTAPSSRGSIVTGADATSLAATAAPQIQQPVSGTGSESAPKGTLTRNLDTKTSRTGSQPAQRGTSLGGLGSTASGAGATRTGTSTANLGTLRAQASGTKTVTGNGATQTKTLAGSLGATGPGTASGESHKGTRTGSSGAVASGSGTAAGTNASQMGASNASQTKASTGSSGAPASQTGSANPVPLLIPPGTLTGTSAARTGTAPQSHLGAAKATATDPGLTASGTQTGSRGAGTNAATSLGVSASGGATASDPRALNTPTQATGTPVDPMAVHATSTAKAELPVPTGWSTSLMASTVTQRGERKTIYFPIPIPLFNPKDLLKMPRPPGLPGLPGLRVPGPPNLFPGSGGGGGSGGPPPADNGGPGRPSRNGDPPPPYQPQQPPPAYQPQNPPAGQPQNPPAGQPQNPPAGQPSVGPPPTYESVPLTSLARSVQSSTNQPGSSTGRPSSTSGRASTTGPSSASSRSPTTGRATTNSPSSTRVPSTTVGSTSASSSCSAIVTAACQYAVVPTTSGTRSVYVTRTVSCSTVTACSARVADATTTQTATVTDVEEPIVTVVEGDAVPGGQDLDNMNALFGPMEAKSLATGFNVPTAPAGVESPPMITMAPFTATAPPFGLANLTALFNGTLPTMLKTKLPENRTSLAPKTTTKMGSHNATATRTSGRLPKATATHTSGFRFWFPKATATRKPTTTTPPPPPPPPPPAPKYVGGTCNIHVRQYNFEHTVSAIIEVTDGGNNWIGSWSFARREKWGTKIIIPKTKLDYEISVRFRDNITPITIQSSAMDSTNGTVRHVGNGTGQGQRGDGVVPSVGPGTAKPPRNGTRSLERRLGNDGLQFGMPDIDFHAGDTVWSTRFINEDVLPHCVVGGIDSHENLKDLEFLNKFLEDGAEPTRDMDCKWKC